MDSPRLSMSSHESHYESISIPNPRSSALTEFSEPDSKSPHPTIRITGSETRLDEAVRRTRNTFDNIVRENLIVSRKVDKIDGSLTELQDVRHTVTELSSKVDDLGGLLKALNKTLTDLQRASEASFTRLEQKIVSLDTNYDDRFDALETIVQDGFAAVEVQINTAFHASGDMAIAGIAAAEMRVNNRINILIA